MASAAIYDSDLEEGGPNLDVGVEDSDDESLTDEQSPADGYFERREHPQQVFEQNPEAQSRKEKIAAEERARAANAGAARFSSRWEDESAPVLDAGPPPPDYESATADRRHPPQQAFDSDHPLVRNGLFDAQATPASRSRQPQSMGDSTHVHFAPGAGGEGAPSASDGAAVEEATDDENTGLLGQQVVKRRRKARRCWNCSCSKSCMMVLGILTLIILAIVATKKPSRGRFPKDGDTYRPPNQNLPIEGRPKGPDLSHPSKSGHCSFTSFSDTQPFHFNTRGEDFEFVELIDSSSYQNVFPNGARISGTVRISPANEIQENDVMVWVNIATNDLISVRNIRYSTDQGFLQLFFPDIEYTGWRQGDPACVDFAVAIHVRNGTRVRNWDTSTANLNVVVDSGVFGSEELDGGSSGDGLAISGQTSFSAVSGDVDVAYWSSRKTRVDTNSGSIKGTYALRDLLSLRSSSGSIKVNVEPKAADRQNPAPAEFIAATSSGSVHVEYMTDHGLPDRDYDTRVETQSSSIAGTYVIGSSASFSSNSGSIKVDVLPYSAYLPGSVLRTENMSGSTRLELLSPYLADWHDSFSSDHRDGVIDNLKSRHKSVSGSVRLKYPQEWEGKFEGKSISGSIHLKGKDVYVVVEADLPVGRRLTGHKGSGESELNVQTMSGSIRALLGDE